ncbi:MAG: T9SS type A sorting domain-containing protein [Ignavibacteriales bacterium]|nr:T9SS type A sorting domain-containing protein [Ignavibacteriales bacterium]
MFSSGTGFVCDENNIYKTIDGSQSWTKVVTPAIANKFLTAFFSDEDNGIFAGNNIYRLDNSGTPAVYFDLPLRNSTYGVNLITMSWFSSNLTPIRLTMFLSSDNGQTWEQILSNLPSDTNNVVLPRLLNAQNAFVKLTGGVISATSPRFSIKLNSPVILFSPNEIAHYVQNDGLTSYNRMGSSSGFYWPKDMGSTAIFEDGIVWAGKIGTEVRSGGSAYRSGLQPGNILPNGLPAQLEPGTERSTYEGNYNSWPGELGAPFEDVNHDGRFTRGVDKPRILGEQTAWFVANDLNPALTSFFAGTQPMGIEMQVTEFGYNTSDLKNVLFKKVCLINKGSLAINDYHVGIWSDPDLGDASDDFVGCDTVLNLEYVYNGDGNDAGANGYGNTPPALGYYCVQPPVTMGLSSDSAFFFGRYHKGYKAVRMESFNLYLGGSTFYKDWELGQAAGSQQLFNNLNGLLWDGSAILDPIQGGTPTKFIVPGNPVAGTGWYEGAGWPGGVAPGDRRMLMSFGPRNFNPGDTMEFVYAYVIGRGSNNINSITKMKELANTVSQQYAGLVATAIEKQETGIPKFGLLQNYPNPFNPSSRIIYSLAQAGNVSLKVYDVLGNEVATLTDGWQQAGTHEVVFNSAQHKQLASGVYFYRLQAGVNSVVKKMLLMK